MHNKKGLKQKAPEGCLWIEDAASYLGVAYNTLRKWRVLGKEPGTKGFAVGHRFIAFKISDLDAYLDGQYQAAVAPDPEQENESRPPEALISRKPAKSAA